jgi:alpha-D-xyloside xylohydrolase
LLWQIPVIKHVDSLVHLQKQKDESFFIKEGYGVRQRNGDTYRIPEGWFKDSMVIDYSNPAALKWWFDKRRYLIDDLKVDGFKTDGGECIFGNDLVFHDGRTGSSMRNAYPKDYISAYYDFVRPNNGITFSRSGYTGMQSTPAHWAGDERSTWEAFRRSLMAGLSAGMSGVIFWGWDFAGFSGPIPTAELYIRSAQMACFCPIMQYHAESKAEFNQDRTPWNIAERTGDNRALTIYRYFANLRMSLIPYMAQESEWSVKQRSPLMRALVLDYQSDEVAQQQWDSYLFGRDLFVAPVISEGAIERNVILPNNRWWHLFEESWYDAGQHKVAANIDQIPVFVRENSLLPLALTLKGKLGDAMQSDISLNNDRVILSTALTDGKWQYSELNLGLDLKIEVKGDSVIINYQSIASGETTLVFSENMNTAIVNGREQPITEVIISKKLLCCVKLSLA